MNFLSRPRSRRTCLPTPNYRSSIERSCPEAISIRRPTGAGCTSVSASLTTHWPDRWHSQAGHGISGLLELTLCPAQCCGTLRGEKNRLHARRFKGRLDERGDRPARACERRVRLCRPRCPTASAASRPGHALRSQSSRTPSWQPPRELPPPLCGSL